MIKRRTKLRDLILQQGLKSFLITHMPNIRYLTGFTGSAGILLILPDETHFFTDFRYQEQCKDELDKDIEVHIVQDSWKELIGFLKPVRTLGFEAEFLSYFNYNKLKEEASWLELVPLEGTVLRERAVKDELEIDTIREAQGIADALFKEILDLLEPGKFTERNIANEMEYRMKKHGAEGIAFETIVASGPHSALPHARPRPVPIEENTMLLLDFGAKYDGYASDMTRTIWIGKRTDPRFLQIYEIVRDSLEKAVLGAKPGMKAVEIDALARDHIASMGFGEYFGHGLGHGVGLEVHERPVLSPRSQNVVEENEVFTIEPGIYLPGFGGVRIEELVVMRSHGVEVLTTSPRYLIIL